MKHIDTQVERLQQIGAEEFEHIAVYRCSHCRKIERQAFDPQH